MIEDKMEAKRRPVMVFAGEFWAGASGSGLADGFRTLGWLVQEIDTCHYFAQSGGRFALKVASRLTRGMSLAAYEQKLIKECRVLRPDVFLTIKGVGVAREVLEKIRASGTRTVMFYPDVHFDHDSVHIDSFEKFDLFVTTKCFQLPWLESKLSPERVAYVPHAHSFLTHVPPYVTVGESGYHFDILYAGSHSPYKQLWLQALVPLTKELSIGIMGHRWDDPAVSNALRGIEVLGNRENIGYAEAIQRARINVAVHFGPTESGWQDSVSTRTFEIPACGGFMLHIDNDEVREFFEPGKEIDVFSSPEELKDKIKFYLANPGLRERMKDRAYMRCRAEHSYRNRAADITRILAERGILKNSVMTGTGRG